MSTFEPRYKDLVTLLNASVEKFAGREVFGTKKDGQWGWITYGAFGKLVDNCRGGLAASGVDKGDRVACISNNRVEWATAAYATYGLGAAWVPMYEAQQEKEWKFILNDCGAKVVFAANATIHAKLVAMQPELPSLKHVFAFDMPEADPASWSTLLAKGAAKPVPAQAADPTSISGYIYTSGTTGDPKGVLLTHANLAYNASANLSVFPISPEHRSLSFLPWAHSFGQTAELHTLLGAGASLGLCEGIPFIIPNLAEVRPTILMAVPNIFNKIYDGVQKKMASESAPVQWIFRTGMRAQSKVKKGESLGLAENLALTLAKKLVFGKIVARFGGKLQFAMSGGAALSREVAEFVDNLGILVFEGYGLTETSPVATVNTPDARRIGSVGKPIPGVTVKLDHDASGDKVEGEIVVYGHNVMKGYYNRPKDTADVFTADGGFRTGDLGKFDSDGFLFITGRIKELYKLENGKYVAPAALEGKLQLSPYILQAMVFGANKPFNIAVLVPNFPNLKDWAAKNGVTESEPADLVKNEKVKALIKSEVAKQGAEFKGFEGIKDFVVGSEEFTVANDMLTPKMSMKRRNVVKRFQPEIDALYAAAAAAKA